MVEIIDLERAYDRVDWGFLKQLFVAVGFFFSFGLAHHVLLP